MSGVFKNNARQHALALLLHVLPALTFTYLCLLADLSGFSIVGAPVSLILPSDPAMQGAGQAASAISSPNKAVTFYSQIPDGACSTAGGTAAAARRLQRKGSLANMSFSIWKNARTPTQSVCDGGLPLSLSLLFAVPAGVALEGTGGG